MSYHVALTDLGKARANNEDHFIINDQLDLFILADGIGGHNFGEVAAKKACEVVEETIHQIYQLSPPQDLETGLSLLKFAIYNANRQIYQMALDDPTYKGMGTTLVVVLKFQEFLLVGHVGDSRFYQCRDQLLQLTDDHTFFVQKSPKSRSLRAKHYLTKSVGLKEFIEPSIKVLSYCPDSSYLLCSDGLSDYLDPDKIKNIILQNSSLDQKARLLLDAALATEAKDNITFILIDKGFHKKKA